MKLVLILSLIVFVFASGCIGQQAQTNTGGPQLTSMEQQAKDACIQLCQSEKAKGTNLDNGPCLSNEIVNDWVCDVAHLPRQAVDNLAGNQCSAFGKTAQHFVEVDPECGFIRSV